VELYSKIVKMFTKNITFTLGNWYYSSNWIPSW